jgi:hypothetical protein
MLDTIVLTSSRQERKGKDHAANVSRKCGKLGLCPWSCRRLSSKIAKVAYLRETARLC